ncbi:preprotein translocase subunit SecA [Microbacterium mangrovi]|uniref:Probable replication restart protein PriA n=1 Tax=Microbacterium mangrovi TaxID=1348253 RepID=A0A0B2A640_9MICO|nr:hypothetical protein [Microbacterium mangrovi]KHK98979.1 preprotein translocase subunit SecA [Microbacterium mangrovi]
MARVVVDSPLPQLDRLFDYAIPDELAAAAVPGVRVKVPLRSAGRMLDAFIVEVGEEDAADRPLSPLDEVVSPVEVLPASLHTLVRRVADRAAGSASDILRLVIPKRMVRAEKAWLAREDDTDADPVPAPALEAARGVLDAFPTLREKLAAGERVAVSAPPRTVAVDAAPGEAPRTVGAWAVLLASAAIETLAAGRSAVLVVPDHRDQAQLEAALADRVDGDFLVRDDARRSGPERYAAYLRVLSPRPCIVIGNRSAVYAPAHDVGLVALWDDSDPLLAEPLSPGVHARDAALVRQELEGCALLFAGHTRSTDVERLVGIGWVTEVRAARPARPRVVLSATTADDAPGRRVPSVAYAAAREALAHGPVLVQVARPGYAPSLVCAECRRPARCAHCGGPLRANRRGAVPVCGWCGLSAADWRCPHCRSDRVRMGSSGSERTADELGRAFPNTRVIVADGAHPVDQVDERPALVVATRGAEPVAVGGYRAVLLLDADRMLQADDLRTPEHCLRWWSNAAALAAPDAPVHLVAVAGPVARALATWSQPAYARGELAERAPLLMPPVARVARLEGPLAQVDAALIALRSDVPDLPDEAVLGPVAQQDDTGVVRALVRFDYPRGRLVAESLRASVIRAALRTRSRPKAAGGASRAPGNTLRVRLDIPDPEL